MCFISDNFNLMHPSKILFFLFFTVIILLSCKKDTPNPVPYKYVNFEININDPQYVALQAVGNSIFVYGGVSGIVIFRESDTEFAVFDRCCPNNPDKRNAIKLDSTNTFILKCPSCGSEFIINNGSVNKGPASAPQKAYHSSFDGTYLHVYN